MAFVKRNRVRFIRLNKIRKKRSTAKFLGKPVFIRLPSRKFHFFFSIAFVAKIMRNDDIREKEIKRASVDEATQIIFEGVVCRE